MAGFLLLGSGGAWAQPANPPTEYVTVAGKKMACQSAGLATRKPGEPVVVFEGGVGAGLENFTPLWPGLTSGGVPWLAYARSGMPGSEADAAVRTDRQVVERLHALLQARRVPPPYLLVGHSLGGPLVRLFAALYPAEVAGLVLLDPTNFLLTAAADEQIRTQSGSALGYQKTFVAMLGKQAADPNIPAGVRADMQRAAEANRTEYFPGYRALAALPKVPVRVLLAYNSPVEGGETQLAQELGLKQPAWFAQVNQRRMTDFAELIQYNPHSAVTLLPGYVHVIHHMDPTLVTRNIQDVYQLALAAKK
jgi:pimeloyl-ACP methyl ester carboxylesterase